MKITYNGDSVVIAWLLGLVALVASPLVVFISALIRGLILGLPVMWLLGIAHRTDGLHRVPALGYWASALIVALLALLIPSNTKD